MKLSEMVFILFLTIQVIRMLVFAIEATKTGYMRSNIGFVDGRRSWFISYFKKRIASNLVYLSFVSGVF